MIGPHEGKELALVLAGHKPFAVFHDAVIEGRDIAEEIIPEQAFAPYVRQGKLRRLAEDIRTAKDGTTIRYVCFAMPDEAWRAEFFLWLKRETLSGLIAHDPVHDKIIGRLLGYEQKDIQEFFRHRYRAT